ncbi:DUF1684 domain-containing protein [Agrococcus jejuensis]|uniref:DUF1684 domain-containing protein n=1 Tax=Agrococcus jejuensis TaxID=399736 RepID=A0A1G8F2W3_9MICO|nr:DUF1684 domain-containing protein [Agrococcus jejuensis]SDH76470.1 hypothetical protein SAMN04489720_2307 [Agrococcus jejuensis]
MQPTDVVDWRRHVFAIYAAVRAAASPEAAHALWRRERDALLRTHPASPVPASARADLVGADVAPYDPAWRFECSLEPADGVRWDVETGTDGIVPFERWATATLPGVGTLDVWRLRSYGGGLFVPVRDALAGRDGGTYGGGRYLVDTVKGADLGMGDGTIVLDLNFAYAPSCAYDPAWACPLPPAGNRVDVPIPVGERHPLLRAGIGR